jgi:hypothetical protein
MRFTIEQKLRRFFRETAEERLERRRGCPDDSEIAAFFDANIAGDERERMEAHLARCVSCREQLAFLARSSDAPLPESVPGDWLMRAQELVQAPRKIVFGRNWRWTAVAAVAACVFLVAVVVLRRPAQRQPSTTSPGRSPASGLRELAAPASAPTLISPTPGAVLDERGLEFRWTPVRDGVEYRVSVLTADGDIVWQKDTEGTWAKPPADVRLSPGQKYFVWIRASLREGKSARSEAVPFSVTGTR